MGLINLSATKLIDPESVTSIVKAVNNSGWFVTYDSCEKPLFITNDEYNKLMSEAPNSYKARELACGYAGGSGTINLDALVATTSMVQFSHGAVDVTYELNFSSIETFKCYWFFPWRNQTFNIVNNSNSDMRIRTGGNVTLITSGNTHSFSTGTSPICITKNSTNVYISM